MGVNVGVAAFSPSFVYTQRVTGSACVCSLQTCMLLVQTAFSNALLRCNYQKQSSMVLMEAGAAELPCRPRPLQMCMQPICLGSHPQYGHTRKTPGYGHECAVNKGGQWKQTWRYRHNDGGGGRGRGGTHTVSLVGHGVRGAVKQHCCSEQCEHGCRTLCRLCRRTDDV